MEANFIITSGSAEEKREYFIQKAFLLDGRCYFTILNINTFDVMFGEYLGTYEDDMEKTREKIYQEFVEKRPNVTYPDGYILDDLYEMWDSGVI